MPSANTDRRTRIADSVIEVLATQGARGLTHRAVDSVAGLPAGSTSYYFRTREALLIAAVRRLADLGLEGAQSSGTAPSTVDALASFLSRMVVAEYTTHRDRTLARYHLSLDADRYPEVQAVLRDMAARFTAVATAMIGQFGSRHPTRDARALVAVCAGIVYESAIGGQRPYTLSETEHILGDFLHARLSDSR